jgi:HK97 family phage portal protein
MLERFRDRIADGMAAIVNRLSTEPRYIERSRVPYSGKSLAGPLVTPDTAVTVPAVWAALRYLSQTVAVLPWHVMRDTPAGGEFAPSNPVDWLIWQRPNPEWSSFQFRETLTHWALRYGNGYAEIERDIYGRPLAMWPLHPNRVDICRDKETGELVYDVRNETSGKVEIPARDMFHVRGFGEGVVGLSVIEYAAESIGWARAAQLFAAAFYGNGATPTTVVLNKKPLRDAGLARQKAEFEQLYKGPRNSHKTAFLDNDADIKRIGLNAQETQLLETQQFLVEEICFVPGTPIITPWGARAIEEIEVGERVLSHTGKWQRVANVMSRDYVGPVVTVQAKGLPAVTATANHPFYVQRVTPDRSHRLIAADAAAWVAAGDLTPARRQADGRRARGAFDALTMPRLAAAEQPVRCLDMAEWSGDQAVVTDSEVRFSENSRASPVNRHVVAGYDLGWLCGLFAADGSTTDHQVAFYLGAHEPDLTAALIEKLSVVFGVDASTTIAGSVARTVVSNRVLARFFSDHGHAAQDKGLPAWCMAGGSELRRGLIDGLVAGDGCEYKARRMLRTTSETLAIQTRVLLWADGINSTLQQTAAGRWEINGRSGTSLPMTTVEWRADAERRGSMGLADGHAYFQLERADTSQYAGKVYNLEVEDDESYTTVGGCVHNCRWFGVPPHKVMHLLRSTFNNIEHQAIEVVVDSISPWAKRFEDEANYKLFGGSRWRGLYTKMNMNALLRGDTKARMELYRGLVMIGVLSPNDVLRLEDMNTIGPDGDIHVMQEQMSTLEFIRNKEQKPSPTADIGGNDGDDEDNQAEEDDPEAEASARRILEMLGEPAHVEG